MNTTLSLRVRREGKVYIHEEEIGNDLDSVEVHTTFARMADSFIALTERLDDSAE